MGSIQMPAITCHSALPESSCGYLLQELMLIWDEVGDNQLERQKVLLELEQECLEVYRRKVDIANISRARLHQQLAESEAEFTHLLVSLGERSFPGRPEKMAGTLKEQLDSITPALQEMRWRKEGRIKQFREVKLQIQRVSAEISGQSDLGITQPDITVNDNELSLNKLEEYQNELQRLHTEKKERLLKVEEYRRAVHDLAATMGMDSSEIIKKVHPSLDGSIEAQSKNISDLILDRFRGTIELLKEEKQKRQDKLHKLGKALVNLWSLIDTPLEDQRSFAHVTGFTSSRAKDISKSGSITLDIIQQAESEVQRLDQLKASKMKELFLRKRIELEEICKKSHMEIPSQSQMDNIMKLIDSGEMDHADLLTRMDEQIIKAKDEACSRKNIMEKVEKWMATCDEERWLDEYDMDENRYSVSRGAHKKLQRAERARITVKKIPILVDLLKKMTVSWEEGRKKLFLFDEVPLLAMLEEYNLLRREKEDEKQRQREKKRIQGQPVAEHEYLFVSRPNTSSCRHSDRSLNGSLGSTASLCKSISIALHQRGSNRNSTSQDADSVRENKKMQKRYHKHVSHLGRNAATEISSEPSPS